MKQAAAAIKRRRRLNRRRDFRRVYSAGRVYRGKFISFFSCSNALPYHRIAIVVSRKVEPLSTRRNYLRRIIREAYRNNPQGLKRRCDTIFKLHRRPDSRCFDRIKQELQDFYRKQTQND